MTATLARELWRTVEPFHMVWLAPEVRPAYEAASLAERAVDRSAAHVHGRALFAAHLDHERPEAAAELVRVLRMALEQP